MSDKTIPMRKLSQERVKEDIEEKMSEMKKALGESIGESIGLFEPKTIGVVVTGKASLKAVNVALSLAVYHHISLVIFSKTSTVFEKKVIENAHKLGVSYTVKKEIEPVDLLIIANKKDAPKTGHIVVLRVL